MHIKLEQLYSYSLCGKGCYRLNRHMSNKNWFRLRFKILLCAGRQYQHFEAGARYFSKSKSQNKIGIFFSVLQKSFIS
jgi:hypothetical protein